MDDLKPLIRFYISAFWRRRWSIALVAWLICLIGWFTVALLPNRYEATAKLYVDTDSIIDPLMKGLAITPDIDRQIEVMRQTLLSRPNVEQIIRRADLDLKLADPPSRLEREVLVNSLVENIRVRAEGRNLYQISFQSRFPEEAYRIVDSVLQIFVEQNVGVTQRDVDTARGFIDRQIAEYEVKLREAELAVAEFKRENAMELRGVEQAQLRLETAEAQLRSLRSDRDSAIWNRDQLQAQLSVIPQTLAGAQLPGGPAPAEQRLSELQANRDRLLLVYTERHPDVRALDALIASAQEQGEGSVSAGFSTRTVNPVYVQVDQQLRSTETGIRDLERQIGLIEEEIGRLTVMVTQTPQVEADLTRLTRDYEVLFNNYQELIQRRESAQFAKRLDSETDRIEFRVVEPPFVPVTPSGPPHGLMMAGVLLVGIGVGGGLAFLRIQLDESFTTVAQLQERFNLPVLGAIELVRSSLYRRVRLIEAATLGSVVIALFITFTGLFYLYHFQDEKPNLQEFANALRSELSQRFKIEI